MINIPIRALIYVDPVERLSQLTGALVCFSDDGKQRRDVYGPRADSAEARNPAGSEMAKIPCARTLKGWCDQGFESWLACQNGTGQMSWTLEKSKFSHRQVLEWFSFKDELFNNQSTSSDSSDDTGKV